MDITTSAIGITNYWNQKGYKVKVDKITYPGYIFWGIADSGTLESQGKWRVLRAKVSGASNGLLTLEWGGKKGIDTANLVWNSSGGDTYTGATDIF
jgi:hypothetical protein